MNFHMAKISHQKHLKISISKNDVINKDVLKVFEDFVTCKICLDLVDINPKICENCQFIYCKECLGTYHKIKGRVSCPQCGKKKFIAAKNVLRLYDNLIVKCLYGCGKEVDWKNLTFHSFSCPKNSVPAFLSCFKAPIKTYHQSYPYSSNFSSSSVSSSSSDSSDLENYNETAPKKIATKIQQHKCRLYLVNKTLAWKCNLCGKYFIASSGSFCCKKCDFDACMTCAGVEG